MDKLNALLIKKKISTSFIGREVYFYPTLTSTNIAAEGFLGKGASDGTLVICESQTKGRGRSKNFWHSPPGGLWFSLILYIQDKRNFSGITLLASYCIVEVLREKLSLLSYLKWPNDIILNNKKLGGVLAEIKFFQKKRYLILGIGLNVNLKKFHPELENTAISLYQEKKRNLSRVNLLKNILENFEEKYLIFLQKGLKFILPKIKGVSNYLKKEVEIIYQDNILKGIAWDLNPQGALILKLNKNNFKEIYSGERLIIKE
ncbi:MAG: biotin--[acetyl-CoA-carboxylase] ligase [Armatimonadetes bacterium]|nr:biotin--[acetyl-CoA-carboxylase] ligase [Armatimonadota bacterium]